MNDAINNGLMKAAALGISFQQYDAAFRYAPPDKHLPKHFIGSVLTAFTIQMASLFDDGLEDVWNQRKPGTTSPPLGVKVAEFVRQGWFLDPDAVRALVDLRNRLAHETGVFATWEDWDSTYRLIQKELGHICVTFSK